MQKITTFLWFDNNAEEAMEFYTSVFKNSEIVEVHRFGKHGPGPEGSVMSGSFKIEGQVFNVLNGGPMYSFTPAISLFVECENQEEVDNYWEKLSVGGERQKCGWVKDKYGLSWQIIPYQLGKYLYSKDSGKANRVMQSLLQMDKIIIEKLEKAYNG